MARYGDINVGDEIYFYSKKIDAGEVAWIVTEKLNDKEEIVVRHPDREETMNLKIADVHHHTSKIG